MVSFSGSSHFSLWLSGSPPGGNKPGSWAHSQGSLHKTDTTSRVQMKEGGGLHRCCPSPLNHQDQPVLWSQEESYFKSLPGGSLVLFCFFFLVSTEEFNNPCISCLKLTRWSFCFSVSHNLASQWNSDILSIAYFISGFWKGGREQHKSLFEDDLFLQLRT